MAGNFTYKGFRYQVGTDPPEVRIFRSGKLVQYEGSNPSADDILRAYAERPNQKPGVVKKHAQPEDKKSIRFFSGL